VKSTKLEFLDTLDGVYGRAPCHVLPNALWKTRRLLEREEFDCSASLEQGQITRLTARNASMLALFWTQDRAARVPEALLRDADLALLHADYLNPSLRSEFTSGEGYFRLIHRDAPVPVMPLPEGFVLAEVALPSEAAVAADLIGRCYTDLKPSANTVESWMDHPTFSPDLWIWIVEAATGAPAALGIAELDTRIGEGALEWIQVLPGFRGCGLGAVLVCELLRRCAGRTAFVTVSGQIDNDSRPEALYRRCGFQGKDRWWVLRR
jgi:GNAT superfamily N-acetyltransferase